MWRTLERAAVNFSSPSARGLKPTAARSVENHPLEPDTGPAVGRVEDHVLASATGRELISLRVTLYPSFRRASASFAARCFRARGSLS